MEELVLKRLKMAVGQGNLGAKQMEQLAINKKMTSAEHLEN